MAYGVAPKSKKLYVISISSLVFISTWGLKSLVLFLVTVLIDFVVARLFQHKKWGNYSKKILYSCICFHVLVWGYFKTEILTSSEHILIPLGLSFYTFQSIGYVLSVYWKRIESEKSFHKYLAFNAFFPQLSAGPIERVEKILPQFDNLESLKFNNVAKGIYLISFGLFKKMVFVDRLTPLYRSMSQDPASYFGLELVVFAYLGFFLFYLDLSSYTDIARGIGKLFNINISMNFNRPYLSKDLSDMWKRWHISVTSWMTDYIYMPILFKTRNIYLSIVCLYVFFGVWHATTWKYVNLGLYFGLLQILYKLVDEKIPSWRKKVPGFIQTIIFFHLLVVAGTIILDSSYDQIYIGLTNIMSENTLNYANRLLSHNMILVYLSLVAILILENLNVFKNKLWCLSLVSMTLVFLTIIFRSEKSYLFIYLGM